MSCDHPVPVSPPRTVADLAVHLQCALDKLDAARGDILKAREVEAAAREHAARARADFAAAVDALMERADA